MMEVEVQQHSAEELQKARVDVFLSGHNETERAASAPHTQNHEYVFVKTEPRVEVKLEAGVTQPPPVAPVMVVSPIAVPLLVPVATRWSMADAAAVADDDEFLDEGQVDGGDHDDYVPLGQARKPVRGRRVPDLSERKRGRPSDVGTIVDISQMLKLPQKTAAAVLGISESMLCKRFKEFTRRKWPYRQMQKLNATITQVRSMMVRDGRTPQLLHELEVAQRDLEECMTPVRIRFSGPEQLQLARKNLAEIPGVEIFQVDSAEFTPLPRARGKKAKQGAREGGKKGSASPTGGASRPPPPTLRKTTLSPGRVVLPGDHDEEVRVPLTSEDGEGEDGASQPMDLDSDANLLLSLVGGE